MNRRIAIEPAVPDGADILVVPGYRGSGPAHWQSWMQELLPGARRLGGVDWQSPRIAQWSREVAGEIDAARAPLWIVAHSFGCLAAVAAAAGREERVGGLMLVAPADPERFAEAGCRDTTDPNAPQSIARHLPVGVLNVPSLVVASTNDPWLRVDLARLWARRWGSQFIDAGPVGHINVDSGFGPWPAGLELFETFRRQAGDARTRCLAAAPGCRPALTPALCAAAV